MFTLWQRLGMLCFALFGDSFFSCSIFFYLSLSLYLPVSFSMYVTLSYLPSISPSPCLFYFVLNCPFMNRTSTTLLLALIQLFDLQTQIFSIYNRNRRINNEMREPSFSSAFYSILKKKSGLVVGLLGQEINCKTIQKKRTTQKNNMEIACSSCNLLPYWNRLFDVTLWGNEIENEFGWSEEGGDER